jgi:pimeloyl-ACP methyl ester carboxylesterase
MMGHAANAASPGGAASLGDLIGGIKAGAQRLLNLVTYYQMKDRAGRVGFNGANEVLQRVQAKRSDLKLHLVGHSFGGRLVTAAATGPTGKPMVPISSMSLLQAAFSHFGFAKDYTPGQQGFFRRMVEEKHVNGPVVITHSDKDKAVGLAYPIASRIANQIAAAIGDANDPYGGIGRNGAQRTPEAVDLDLLQAGGVYALQPGRLHNLRGDALISGHSDITTPPVAHAILSAIAAT